jgi:hypothetical protein
MTIPIAEAASRLSVTVPSTYTFLGNGLLTGVGKPLRVDTDSITALIAKRQAEAAVRHPDRAAYAQSIRDRLRPPMPDLAYARGFELAAFIQQEQGTKVVPKLPVDARAMWGDGALKLAAQDPALWPVDACRTCFVNISARVLGTPAPRPTEDWRILLGPPCDKDRRRWAKEQADDRAEAVTASAQLAQQEREQTEAQRSALAAQGREMIRKGQSMVAAGTADTVRVTRGGVPRPPYRPAPATDDGSDLTGKVRAQWMKRREEAIQACDVRRVADINNILRGLES